MNGQDAAAVSATGPTADGELTEASAGIVDNQVPAFGADASELGADASEVWGSQSPGWLEPAAAVRAGSSIFTILATGVGRYKGNGNGGGGTTPVGGGGDPPSAVPEPGTMLLMGLGVAGYFGRRKLAKE
jgi:hypothetical protein